MRNDDRSTNGSGVEYAKGRDHDTRLVGVGGKARPIREKISPLLSCLSIMVPQHRLLSSS